jgi:hypothetical protein
LITFALPDTGAASSAMPHSASVARSRAEPSTDIDEHSTISLGFAAVAADSRPDGPVITDSTSFQADTMTNTMSHAARSVTCVATFAPLAASGSAFARVRFQTVRSAPAFARRSAIAYPMRPMPIQPIFGGPAASLVVIAFIRPAARVRSSRRRAA